ncbi:hypothetical protein COLO4_16928 [Corchorus olitorius]|uniref:Uncharacterized protein n=1 Tax=Corchorus olitorius TaxID=93759 RepID=A0A1R3JEY5_9ROSI|nr:hypothetical protein COLO4_16928 [Corchorus olitorius]
MDSYRDEEGEPIMDYDDIQSDPGSPEPRQDLLDDVEDDVDDWGQRDRSQTPVYDTDKVGKPRKRLNDQEGVRTMDDDDFIDDTGVDPADRYGSDNEARSPSHAPQAEEDDEDPEIKELFKMGKKKKKNEKSPAEISLLVENVMAELEVTAEEDAELNRQGKPAINKLKKLPLLTEVLSK